jgi:chorismate synthase
MTLLFVAAGVVAKKILGQSVEFSTEITEIGGERNRDKFAEIIEQARMAQESVGGVVECRVDGDETGLGEPIFDSAESLIAHLLFSVPAVKGVEFGDGFEVARKRGSQNNDCICNAEGKTSTNHAGGIVGGITNGNEIVVRAAVKPTASISREQQTYNFENCAVEPLVIKGRHDVCIALRAAVVIESAIAIALADLKLRA